MNNGLLEHHVAHRGVCRVDASRAPRDPQDKSKDAGASKHVWK